MKTETVLAFTEGMIKEFNTVDSRLLKYKGMKVVIETVFDTPDAEHDEEVLPMYAVRVHNTDRQNDNAIRFEAYHDELDGMIKLHPQAEPDKKKDLDELLEEWAVMEPGLWENNDGPKDWYAVSNDEGIVAYFRDPKDAFGYRLTKINNILNY